MLKSKIHCARVTQAELNYYGSISIDRKLCELANLLAFEKVDVYNCHNGQRFSTYVIHGKKGQICLNGAAARLVQPGDEVIIASYACYNARELDQYQPQMVFVNKHNEVIEIKEGMTSIDLSKQT